VHGFGLSALRLVLRYPWYSIDSTTWVMTGRMGAVFVPKTKEDVYIYDIDPWKVDISEKSSSKKKEGQHFDTFTSMEQKIFEKYFKIKGYISKELSNDYKKRDELNIIYFLDLEKSIQKWPWPFKQKKAQGFLS